MCVLCCQEMGAGFVLKVPLLWLVFITLVTLRKSTDLKAVMKDGTPYVDLMLIFTVINLSVVV